MISNYKFSKPGGKIGDRHQRRRRNRRLLRYGGGTSAKKCALHNSRQDMREKSPALCAIARHSTLTGSSSLCFLITPPCNLIEFKTIDWTVLVEFCRSGHQKRRKQVENASGEPESKRSSKMTHPKVWGSLETRQDDMPRYISSHLGGFPYHVFCLGPTVLNV